MELRHLRYFVALAETLSFTRAARSLFISQSTLSQQIADLEHELDAQLVDRTRRKVELTEAGRAALAEARDIIARADRLADTVHDATEFEEHRLLRIGFDSRVLGSEFLKKAICDCVYGLRAGHPGLHVEFRTGEYDGMVDSIAAGGIDLAFFLHQQPRIEVGDAVSRCLYRDELALVVRTPEELEDTPDEVRRVLMRRGVTLLEGESRGTLQAIRIFDDLGVEPPLHFVPGRENLALIINSGECASVLPRGIIGRLVAEGARVLTFDTPLAELDVLAVWHDDADEIVAALLAAVEEALAPWKEMRDLELAARGRI